MARKKNLIAAALPLSLLLAAPVKLTGLTARLADQLRNGGVTIPDAAVRAPHILSVQFPPALLVKCREKKPFGGFVSACAVAVDRVVTKRLKGARAILVFSRRVHIPIN